MIDVACQTYSLRTRPRGDMLTSVRKAGFRSIELWVGHADYAAEPDSASDVRRAADEIGIRIRAYSVGGFVGASLATVEARLTAAFAYAAALGVDVITGVVDRRAVGIVDGLCRRTGIRFGIENHWYAEFARAEDYVPVLEDGVSPLIGVTLDTGHLTAASGDPVAACARFGERLFAVHLKDVRIPSRVRRLVWRRPRMEGCPLGTGEARVADFLATLARAGWSGPLAIEDERPDVPLSELHASLRACTRLLREAAA